MCVCKNGFTGDGFNCTGNKSNYHFDNPDIQSFRESCSDLKNPNEDVDDT